MTDEESNALYVLSFLLIHRYHANPQNSTSSFRGTPWRSPFSAGEGLCCASVFQYSVLERNYLLSSLREGAVAIRRLGEFDVCSIDTNSFRRLTAPPPPRVEVYLAYAKLTFSPPLYGDSRKRRRVLLCVASQNIGVPSFCEAGEAVCEQRLSLGRAPAIAGERGYDLFRLDRG